MRKGMARLNSLGNFSMSRPPRYTSYRFLRNRSLLEVANHSSFAKFRFIQAFSSVVDMARTSPVFFFTESARPPAAGMEASRPSLADPASAVFSAAPDASASAPFRSRLICPPTR